MLTNFSNSGPARIVNNIIDIVLNNPVEKVEGNKRKPSPTPEYLPIPKMISGEYYSPELETTYLIELKDKTTVNFHHSRHGDFSMKMTEKDMLGRGNYAIVNAKIIYDSNNQIIGFRASNGRVKNLWFEKVN